MPIPADLAQSLGAVATALRGAQEEWWVIASAAVALHGVEPIVVQDVDVLLNVGDARRMLPMLGLPTVSGTGDALFRSEIFASWNAPPLTVEFMADLHVCHRSRWIPVRPVTREAKRVGSATVFVPEKAELIDILHMFARPKDVERARLLSNTARTTPPDPLPEA